MRRLAMPLILAALVAPIARAESLWPAGSRQAVTLVADDKAHRVGDVVTVIVQESQSVKNKSTLSLKKDTADTTTLNKLSLPGRMNLDSSFDVDASSSRSLDGQGNFEMDNSIQTYVTCMVTELLPNGNLVIEGSRVNDVGRDKQKIRVSGVVRPRDISSDNAIYSNQLADAKVYVETSGSISRSTNYGWLGKIFDFIWPF